MQILKLKVFTLLFVVLPACEVAPKIQDHEKISIDYSETQRENALVIAVYCIENKHQTTSLRPGCIAILECEHGEFIIDSYGQGFEKNLLKLKEGQKVTVSFKKVIRSTYNEKGKTINKECIGYEFLDVK